MSPVSRRRKKKRATARPRSARRTLPGLGGVRLNCQKLPTGGADDQSAAAHTHSPLVRTPLTYRSGGKRSNDQRYPTAQEH
jgi:hypothetical protein